MDNLRDNAVTIVVNVEEDHNLDDMKAYIQSEYSKDITVQNYLEVDTLENTLCLIYLKDDEIKKFFKSVLQRENTFALLPNENCPIAMKSYGVSKNINDAIDDAFDSQRYINIDLLLCNGEAVLNNVVIGNVHGLNESIEKQNILKRFKKFFENLKELKLQDFTLTTNKEYEVSTAASGIMILEYNLVSQSDGVINDTFYINDGKLNAFILAPTSIISYFYYLIMIFIYAHFKVKSLPKSISVIKTSRLLIESSQIINFKQDNVHLNSKSIELQTLQQAMKLALGRKITNIENFQQESVDEKEIVKTKDLPSGEVKKMLVTKNIPLFKKAEESDFKDLFLSLRDSSKLSSVFLVLMALSTLLATTGLFQNSAPVIIGAMILAPLMAPIVSLSMGVVRAESELIIESSKTLFYGILAALFFSIILTYLIPLNTITGEMRGRLNPNLLDLMVAVISGIAGAYANSKSEISKSLAGVAIAVALVPPLSVTGIGLGWGDFDMVYGSFLLFMTNLVGITLAASLTFLILGYSAVHKAKKGIIYTFVIMAIVTIPLFLSFNKALHQNNIYKDLNNQIFVVNSKKVHVKISQIDLNAEVPLLDISTYSDDILVKKDLLELKDKINEKLKEDVALNILSNTFIK